MVNLISIINSLINEEVEVAKQVFRSLIIEKSYNYPSLNEVCSDVYSFVSPSNCPNGIDCDDFAITLEYAYYGLSKNQKLQNDLNEAYKKSIAAVLKMEKQLEVDEDAKEPDFLKILFDNIDAILHKYFIYDNEPNHLRKTRDQW